MTDCVFVFSMESKNYNLDFEAKKKKKLIADRQIHPSDYYVRKGENDFTKDGNFNWPNPNNKLSTSQIH